MADLSKVLQQSKAQEATDKNHLEEIRTTLNLHKTASPYFISSTAKDYEKLESARAAADAEL